MVKVNSSFALQVTAVQIKTLLLLVPKANTQMMVILIAMIAQLERPVPTPRHQKLL
jgi:hypothetical protein